MGIPLTCNECVTKALTPFNYRSLSHISISSRLGPIHDRMLLISFAAEPNMSFKIGAVFAVFMKL